MVRRLQLMEPERRGLGDRLAAAAAGLRDGLLRDNKVLPPVLAALALIIFAWLLAGLTVGDPGGEERVARKAAQPSVAQAPEDGGASSDTPAPGVENRDNEPLDVYESKDPFRELFPTVDSGGDTSGDATSDDATGGDATGGDASSGTNDFGGGSDDGGSDGTGTGSGGGSGSDQYGGNGGDDFPDQTSPGDPGTGNGFGDGSGSGSGFGNGGGSGNGDGSGNGGDSGSGGSGGGGSGSGGSGDGSGQYGGGDGDGNGDLFDSGGELRR